MAAQGTPFMCLHPKYIMNPYTHERMLVGCGKCSACVARKATRYVHQIELESQYSHSVLFVTLTFANSFIPRLRMMPVKDVPWRYSPIDVETSEQVTDDIVMNPVDLQKLKEKTYLFGHIPYLDKTYVQKFMKRLRKSLSQYSNEKIRYFVCGEYGPEHFRPHFHLLLFLESGKYLNTTRKTLQDFPKWTWENIENVNPNANLSVLECAIRESWQYGSVDASIVEKSASSYVAQYANNIGNLPQVLRMPQTRPFTLHSRFLGFKFCKEQRQEVYASTPEQIVHRGLQVGSVYQEFDMPRSYTNVFFPKCKGYSVKSARERLLSYRIYLTARRYYAETPLLEVSEELAMFLEKYYNEYGKQDLPATFPPEVAILTDYFNKSCLRKYRCYDEYTIEEHATLTQQIYRELCLSRHFLNFVCNGDYKESTSKLYLNKIQEHWNYLDRMKLSRWYEEQAAYSEKDFAADEGFQWFYDNVGNNIDDIIRCYPFQLFKAQCKDKENRLIKHKLQNDLNGMFVNM